MAGVLLKDGDLVESLVSVIVFVHSFKMPDISYQDISVKKEKLFLIIPCNHCTYYYSLIVKAL